MSKLSEKIKMLRKQKGLTLEQVANIVGVGKSTVRKWETGMIQNMGRDKIILLAKALGVSPSYLMGWDDEQTKKPTSESIELSDAELKLIELFRKVPDDKQALVLQMIEVALKNL